jgi:hypothetical protein
MAALKLRWRGGRMRWGQEEQEIRALERRAAFGYALGRIVFLLAFLILILGMAKSLYETPPGPGGMFSFGDLERRLIDPWLQEYRVLSFIWGLMPTINFQTRSLYVLLGVMAIGGLLIDRNRRMRRVLQEARWTSPYLRRREGIETIVNIGAHPALPESGWGRFVRVSEGVLAEVIAGVILLLIGLHSCFNR